MSNNRPVNLYILIQRILAGERVRTILYGRDCAILLPHRPGEHPPMADAVQVSDFGNQRRNPSDTTDCCERP